MHTVAMMCGALLAAFAAVVSAVLAAAFAAAATAVTDDPMNVASLPVAVFAAVVTAAVALAVEHAPPQPHQRSPHTARSVHV